jgi:methionyl aminopeptidase
MKKNMKISIKTQSEIQKMRIAGKLASEVLEMIEPYVIPGVSTEELDRRCYEHIVNVQKAIPANVGYRVLKKLFVLVLIKLFVMAYLIRIESLKRVIF